MWCTGLVCAIPRSLPLLAGRGRKSVTGCLCRLRGVARARVPGLLPRRPGTPGSCMRQVLDGKPTHSPLSFMEKSESQRELFHPAVYSLNAHSSQVEARSHVEVWVSCNGAAGPQVPEPHHCLTLRMCVNRKLAGLGFEPRSTCYEISSSVLMAEPAFYHTTPLHQVTVGGCGEQGSRYHGQAREQCVDSEF